MSYFTSPSAATEHQYVLGQELSVTVLASGPETDGRHDLSDAALPAGAATPLHFHTRYEERIWIVSGELTVWAGAESVTLHSGDYYMIPRHVPHMIKSGPEGGRLLNITSPAGFAELIARAATPVHLATPETEVDAGLFAAVAEELGDVVLGPPGTLPGEVAHPGA